MGEEISTITVLLLLLIKDVAKDVVVKILDELTIKFMLLMDN